MASFRLIWEGAIFTFDETETKNLESAQDVSARNRRLTRRSSGLRRSLPNTQIVQG
jgi:hypothetical protein